MMDDLLTVKEYAKLKNVSVQSVYKRLNAGLKDYAVDVDGKKYIKRSVLDVAPAEAEPEPEEPAEEKVYSAEYVELLKEQIEDLKQDKVFLEKALDQQQQLMLLDKQEILRLQEQLALVAPAEAEPEPEEPAEPEPKKKGFFARLFGG